VTYLALWGVGENHLTKGVVPGRFSAPILRTFGGGFVMEAEESVGGGGVTAFFCWGRRLIGVYFSFPFIFLVYFISPLLYIIFFISSLLTHSSPPIPFPPTYPHPTLPPKTTTNASHFNQPSRHPLALPRQPQKITSPTCSEISLARQKHTASSIVALTKTH
jgi:hypothetical protein